MDLQKKIGQLKTAAVNKAWLEIPNLVTSFIQNTNKTLLTDLRAIFTARNQRLEG